MRKWTLKEKKKLLVVLVTAVLSGVFGYIETLIPPVFATLPYLRIHLGVLFALFVLLCYGPAEATIVVGTRCIVFGLVQNDGYAIIFEWIAFCVAMIPAWLLLRKRVLGSLPVGAVIGITYAFLYASIASIIVKSGALFAQIAQSMAFYMVNHLLLGALAYMAIRFIPEKLLLDN